MDRRLRHMPIRTLKIAVTAPSLSLEHRHHHHHPAYHTTHTTHKECKLGEIRHSRGPVASSSLKDEEPTNEENDTEDKDCHQNSEGETEEGTS